MLYLLAYLLLYLITHMLPRGEKPISMSCIFLWRFSFLYLMFHPQQRDMFSLYIASESSENEKWAASREWADCS